jgi:hypothetical protein
MWGRFKARQRSHRRNKTLVFLEKLALTEMREMDHAADRQHRIRRHRRRQAMEKEVMLKRCVAHQGIGGRQWRPPARPLCDCASHRPPFPPRSALTFKDRVAREEKQRADNELKLRNKQEADTSYKMKMLAQWKVRWSPLALSSSACRPPPHRPPL